MGHFRDLCARLFTPPLTVVDIGAAGELVDLGDLNALCEVHAFEPRQEACDGLTNQGGFANVHVHNIGVASCAGPQWLHLTHEPMASSLRQPNIKIAKRYMPNRIFDPAGEAEIECTTLADFAAARSIETIDYIKLDTQGTELDILRGAGALLDRISIIKAEVEFVELYHGQALFDDVLAELSTRGFRFVDFSDGERRGPILGKRIWADAMFVRKSYVKRSAALRAAVLMLALGSIGEGLWLLRDLGIDEETADDLWRAATRQESATWFRWLRDINHARRDAGKLALSGYRMKELIRKTSFGLLE